MLIKHYIKLKKKKKFCPMFYILCCHGYKTLKTKYNIQSNFVVLKSKRSNNFASKYQSIWNIQDKLSWKFKRTTVFTLSYHGNNLSKFDCTKCFFFFEEKVKKIHYEWKSKRNVDKIIQMILFLFWTISRIKLITTVYFGCYASAKVKRIHFIYKYNYLH